ncbi:cytochrome c oxidase assembly protein COX18, mitochondrial [Osmerus eperlanus]|uniref:cytochrome c oxidase assembly protein COX18, mitochondrial n=1 Tax=Osmerus eperlanus TaxID=29151 RepID=UPI002E11DE21
MLWWKVPTVVRAGSLCSGYGLGHLSQCPLLRCTFHAPFSRDYTAHHVRRCPPTSSLQSLYSSVPRLPSLCSQPHRSASGTSGTGWYESLTDSTAVHLTEQLLISTHQATGLPWWATIVCTTLALRTAITLPLGAYQMVILSKVEALQAEIAELAKRLHYEVSVRASQRGWTERDCRYQFKKNLKRIVSELYVRDNCHPFKASVLVWVQLPMWVCLSLALRNLSLGMSEASMALQLELSAGGALWFPDLTLPDATWIMPVSLGLINLLIVEMFALRRLETSKLQKFMTNFIRAISLMMIPIAATVPSSMALYWLASSGVGMGHNLLLRSPRFRSLCRIPRLRSESDTPYRDLGAAFAAKYLK